MCPGFLLALLAFQSRDIKRSELRSEGYCHTDGNSYKRSLCLQALLMEIYPWPPWPMVLADSQQKYVTLGDQCILNLPHGVLYNETSFCTLQGRDG